MEGSKNNRTIAHTIVWAVYFVITAVFLFYNKRTVIGTDQVEIGKGKLIFAGLTAAVLVSAVLVLFVLPVLKKRDENGKGRKLAFKPWHLLLMATADAYSFFMMEYVNNPDFSQMEVRYMLLNIAGIFIIHMILFFWLNSFVRSTMLVYIIWTSFSLVFYFVYLFRGEPFQFIDFFSIATAAEVAGGYSYTFTRAIICMIVCSLCLIALTLNSREYILARKVGLKILMRAGVFVFMIGMYFFYLNVNWNGGLGILTDLFSPIKTYKKVGTTVGFFCVAKYMRLTPPDGYSTAKTEEIAEDALATINAEGYGSSYTPAEDDGDTSALTHTEGGNYADGGNSDWYNSLYDVLGKTGAKKPVNIIAIMNESLADYSYVGNLQTNEPVMPYYESMQDNTIKGHTLVCITGGGTAKTEYEFLTGNSVKRFPGMVPYVSYFTHDQYSLVTTLEAQGFGSAAMHPYKGSNWKRPQAYQLLNFDHFYTQDDFDDSYERVRGFISDRANYQKILEVIDQKKNKDDPFFLFDITMQNHGGYTHNTIEQTIQVNGYADDQVENFLSLERKSDDALRYLIETLKDYDEPTMVIMFGDHYPNLPDSFTEHISGKTEQQLSLGEKMHYYATPFLIWANYDLPEADDVVTSTNFLGTLALSLSGWNMADYNKYLEDMMYQIPALNHMGYLDSTGLYRSWDDAAEEDAEKELDYEDLQYNNLAKKSTRLDWFFGPPGQ
ncbi:MAG: sulfatase-like hydrolase/transferase [Eubacterium sp.]|nr:sulfatase-like hydrolase/transferase [Eubacterium sp.]